MSRTSESELIVYIRQLPQPEVDRRRGPSRVRQSFSYESSAAPSARQFQWMPVRRPPPERLRELPPWLVPTPSPAQQQNQTGHRHGRTHRVGHISVLWAVHFRGAAQWPAQQDVSATNENDRNRKTARLHLVDGILNLTMDAVEHRVHQSIVDAGDT